MLFLIELLLLVLLVGVAFVDDGLHRRIGFAVVVLGAAGRAFGVATFGRASGRCRTGSSAAGRRATAAAGKRGLLGVEGFLLRDDSGRARSDGRTRAAAAATFAGSTRAVGSFAGSGTAATAAAAFLRR